METTNSNTNPKSKSGKLKWWLLGIGILATGGYTLFRWDNVRKKETNKQATPDVETKMNEEGKIKTPTQTPSKPIKRPTAKTDTNSGTNPNTSKQQNTFAKQFPIKKGTKGNLVKLFQQALIKKYGRSILPKWGADGAFGNELEAAIKKASNNTTTVITEMFYYDVVNPTDFIPQRTALKLKAAIAHKKFNDAILWLKTIRNAKDYQAVNAQGFEAKTSNGIVKGLRMLLNYTFTDITQKQKLITEYLRIGFRQKGGMWTLSGLEVKEVIITTMPTKVWKSPREFVSVPDKMVLGESIAQRGLFTMFENDKQYYLVETKTIQPYRNY